VGDKLHQGLNNQYQGEKKDRSGNGLWKRWYGDLSGGGHGSGRGPVIRGGVDLREEKLGKKERKTTQRNGGKKKERCMERTGSQDIKIRQITYEAQQHGRRIRKPPLVKSEIGSRVFKGLYPFSV